MSLRVQVDVIFPVGADTTLQWTDMYADVKQRQWRSSSSQQNPLVNVMCEVLSESNNFSCQWFAVSHQLMSWKVHWEQQIWPNMTVCRVWGKKKHEVNSMKGKSLLSFQGWDSHLCTHGGSVANCLQLKLCVSMCVCVPHQKRKMWWDCWFVCSWMCVQVNLVLAAAFLRHSSLM